MCDLAVPNVLSIREFLPGGGEFPYQVRKYSIYGEFLPFGGEFPLVVANFAQIDAKYPGFREKSLVILGNREISQYLVENLKDIRPT